MGGLLIYCFNRSRHTTQLMQSQISLLESQSLRSQMNPHFIFNVLNGLQSALILKSDREISHYIHKLSGLLRSPKAVVVNINIMRAFVAMRQYAQNYQALAKALSELENSTDQRFAEIGELLDALLEQKQ